MNKYNSKIQSLQQLISKLTNCQAEILNLLINHHVKYTYMFIAQETIGSWLGYSRQTINKATQLLIKLNIIRIVGKRGRSNVYQFVSSFRLDLIAKIWVIREKLPALKKYVNFQKVMASELDLQKKHLEQKATLCIEEEDIYNIYLKDYSHVARARHAIKQFFTSMAGMFTIKQDRFKNKSIKTPEKGVFVMSQHAKPTISPLMRQITEALKLTKHGQVRLLIYEEKSLQSAFDNINKAMDHKDPFAYFGEHCHGYSIQHGLPIKMELYEAMLKRYDISVNAPYVLAKPKAPAFKVVPAQKNLDFTTEIEHFKENQQKMHPSFSFAYPGSN